MNGRMNVLVIGISYSLSVHLFCPCLYWVIFLLMFNQNFLYVLFSIMIMVCYILQMFFLICCLFLTLFMMIFLFRRSYLQNIKFWHLFSMLGKTFSIFLNQFFFFFFFLVFWLCLAACGILVPQAGIKTTSPAM